MQLIVTSYIKEKAICSFVDGSTEASQVFFMLHYTGDHTMFSGFAHRNFTKRSRSFIQSSPYVKEKVRHAVS